MSLIAGEFIVVRADHEVEVEVDACIRGPELYALANALRDMPPPSDFNVPIPLRGHHVDVTTAVSKDTDGTLRLNVTVQDTAVVASLTLERSEVIELLEDAGYTISQRLVPGIGKLDGSADARRLIVSMTEGAPLDSPWWDLLDLYDRKGWG